MDDSVFKLIQSHFEKLELIEKNEEEAIGNYLEIEKRLNGSASESGVKKYLENLRNNTLGDIKEY